MNAQQCMLSSQVIIHKHCRMLSMFCCCVSASFCHYMSLLLEGCWFSSCIALLAEQAWMHFSVAASQLWRHWVAHSHWYNAKQYTFDLNTPHCSTQCSAVCFHISIKKAPVNPQGYESGRSSLSTLKRSCFCSQDISQAPRRGKSPWECVECSSWGLQKAMKPRPQPSSGRSTFVITGGYSRRGPRLQHWQQYTQQ